MKKSILVLSFFAAITMNGQTIVKGDMNDDGDLTITDVTSIVRVILGEAPKEYINLGNGIDTDPYKVDNSLVVGSWNVDNGTTLELNEDGTTNYSEGYTYKFRPYQGTLMFYDATGKPVKTLVFNEVSDTYLLSIDYSTGAYTKYTNSTTLSSNHQFVDLGLPSGTLWATCNIGAENPENAGYYFAWGETVPYGMEDETNEVNYYQTGSYTKTKYDWSTYKWCDGTSNIMTKYNENDEKAELDPEDDAAYVLWGASWRMPSKEQIEELLNTKYTKVASEKLNGVYGRRIISLKNGNSIFFPFTGFYHSVYSNESYFNGWSRTVKSDNLKYAHYFYVSNNGNKASYTVRYYGYTIRPVFSKNY